VIGLVAKAIFAVAVEIEIFWRVGYGDEAGELLTREALDCIHVVHIAVFVDGRRDDPHPLETSSGVRSLHATQPQAHLLVDVRKRGGVEERREVDVGQAQMPQKELQEGLRPGSISVDAIRTSGT
jgi:hypothetical protein